MASIRTPEGLLLIRAVALSTSGSATAQGERAQQFQRRIASIEKIRDRATARGENPRPWNRSSTNSSHRSTYARSSASPHPPTGHPELLVSRLLNATPPPNTP
ncbi:hypothetical protein [Streptomyces sp. NPDC086519]|uniref:hypothetical protein n=1 Tax=Streptomyces sp. NPDC086519 TaxID=3154863 RepID=UPI00342649AF